MLLVAWADILGFCPTVSVEIASQFRANQLFHQLLCSYVLLGLCTIYHYLKLPTHSPSGCRTARHAIVLDFSEHNRFLRYSRLKPHPANFSKKCVYYGVSIGLRDRLQLHYPEVGLQEIQGIGHLATYRLWHHELHEIPSIAPYPCR